MIWLPAGQKLSWRQIRTLPRVKITQYFNDVSHWNNTRGKIEGIIDPDPDGSMHRLGDALDKMLAAESASTPNVPDHR